jgi:hypothetical protein
MKKVISPVLIAIFIFFLMTLAFSGKGFLPSSATVNAAGLYAQDNIWHNADPNSIILKGERVLLPVSYRTLRLNAPELKSLLLSAPLEENVSAKNSGFIVSLPMPDGSMSRFSVVESPIMEYGLAIKYPEFKTYSGQGIDNPAATVRFDITELGFHAMILSPDGDVFIDPFSRNEKEYYISYYKKDFRSSVDKQFVCHTEGSDLKTSKPQNITDASTGEQLRTYRLAIGATGEYTAYFGGTVSGALSAITTSVNRITGVYEKDLSVRLVLIANENLIIYTNASTDPYTNTNGNTMLGQNQSNLDAVIGNANYDIGHVYSTWSGGGIAGLSVVCATGQKARGVTGSPAPVGDPWDIDYVAHEMGHQFAGNHTQNNLNCNANPSTAWEPGSGVTIMGYAGVCSPSLANNSIPIFHGGSIFGEMVPFTQQGSGNGCANTTSTGNNPPVLGTMPTTATLPISTPFALTGTATDPNGDVLTYCWEQHDVGPQGNPNSPTGNAPLFRSFNPVSEGTRVFPKWSDIINNTQTLGERLPTYGRNMMFWLTVRDNRAGGGGVAYGSVFLQVSAGAGPFVVTAPNTAVSWPANSTQTVTWDVANTSAAPVSCANVKITLSTDGGNTYPTVLLASTPNDGSQSVTIPNSQTTTARIRIEAVGNYFFDISNANFTISSPSGITNNNTAPLEFELAQNYPNPFNPSTFINYSLPYNSKVTLEVYDLSGKLAAKLINNEFRTAGNYSVEFDGSSLASGIYYYKITTAKNTAVRKMILVK